MLCGRMGVWAYGRDKGVISFSHTPLPACAHTNSAVSYNIVTPPPSAQPAMKTYRRREFIKQSALFTAGVSILGAGCQSEYESASGSTPDETAQTAMSATPLFTISLAEWSLNQEIRECRGTDGPFANLDFARIARQEYDIDAVEYVNQCFFDKGKDIDYLREMKTIADGEGVRSLLIMCDREGNLGDPDEAMRTQAVENHHKWVEAAQFLGCHSIRVNARSDASLSYEEQQRLAADGLRRLCEFADPYDINVIVENHGGLSSNGQWLAGVMDLVEHPRVGTLPDFGNFLVDAQTGEWYDRYQGVAEMMPYAKAVSAKTMDFDEDGNCVETDYLRMMKIVLDAGYRGRLGIEYEGPNYSYDEGIKLTKALLERVRDELAGEYS
jgi:L-ribulose-5-phosphate 3-epimerase